MYLHSRPRRSSIICYTLRICIGNSIKHNKFVALIQFDESPSSHKCHFDFFHCWYFDSTAGRWPNCSTKKSFCYKTMFMCLHLTAANSLRHKQQLGAQAAFSSSAWKWMVNWIERVIRILLAFISSILLCHREQWKQSDRHHSGFESLATNHSLKSAAFDTMSGLDLCSRQRAFDATGQQQFGRFGLSPSHNVSHSNPRRFDPAIDISYSICF